MEKRQNFAVSIGAESYPDAHYDAIVAHMRRALADIGGVTEGARLLDFGCGHGLHLRAYLRADFDAYGCDTDPYWSDNLGGRLRPIEAPYRIPYPDNHFDAVVSTSVLEHAQNTADIFAEIRRVLKPGGVALHLFPTRWYLPSEPHIFVPLANVFWPNVPRWWLALWALLGVRNGHQVGMTWREVAEWNVRYCRDGLSYLTCRSYERMSMDTFGNFLWPSEHMIEFGQGGYAALTRKLPFRRFWGWLGRHTRIALLLHRK